MAKLPRIIPVTDLRQDAAAVLRQVAKSCEPFVITQRGRATAVLLSAEAYQKAESERQMLRLLVEGEKEMVERHGIDLDTVIAEADARLTRGDS